MIIANHKSEWIIYLILSACFSLILLYLIWYPPYFPSQDGPSHLYNAWVMKELGNPEYPLINASYTIRIGLIPNWSGYAVMFLLMHFLPPLAAEKIWISLIVLGVPWGLTILSRTVSSKAKDPSIPWWSLLGFFLALNHPLYKGLQNHGMGLVLFILILAYFWKNDIRNWTVGRMMILNILLLATYFCHIVSFVISLIAIVFLQISNRESGKKNLIFLAALVPMGLLLLYYGYSTQAGYGLKFPGWEFLWRDISYLGQGKMLAGFNFHGGWYIVLMAMLGVGVLSTVSSFVLGYRIRKQWDKSIRLLVLALLLFLIYLISPDEIGSGKYLNMRLALYPLFPLIAGLKTPRKILWRSLLVGFILILTLAHFEEYREVKIKLNRHYQRIVTLAKQVPNHSFVATSRNFLKLDQELRPLLHAVSYGIIGKDIVNLTNYEARLSYFPIKWSENPELKWPIYFLSRSAHDYTISPLDNKEFPADLFYRDILREK